MGIDSYVFENGWNKKKKRFIWRVARRAQLIGTEGVVAEVELKRHRERESERGGGGGGREIERDIRSEGAEFQP